MYYQITAAIFSAFLVNICSAQTIIHVKSYEDQRPLPYASVVNLTKHQLFFSDEYGMVEGASDIGDSVFISYVGFQNLKVAITDSVQTFLLKQSTALLEPVKIVNCRDLIKHEYSNLISDTSTGKFGGVANWSKGGMNNRFAVMLTPKGEDLRLQAFSIWLETRYREIKYQLPKIALRPPIIFSFYSVDETTMLPGELITNQQIIYYPQKEGKQTIRLDSVYIKIPNAGLYVAFQYVYNDMYLYPQRFINKEKGIDSIYMAYGARIDGVFSKQIPLAFYDYKTNRWVFPGNKDKSIRLEPHGTIKFSAQLTSCKEKRQG